MENKKLPTATTLFKFMHVQTSRERNKVPSARFIENLAFREYSPFIMAIEGLETQEEIDAALATAVEAFTPLKNAQAVRDIDPATMKFGQWVCNPKSDLFAPGAIEAKSAGLTLLSDGDLLLLWNNLHYLAITKGSERTRDAIITMLKGSLFNESLQAYLVENPKDPEEEPTQEYINFVKNLAASIVIIPSVLVSRQKQVSTDTAPDNMSQYQKDALTKLQASDIAKFNIRRYKNTVDELRRAKSLFDDALRKEYQAALQEHTDEVNELISEAPIDPETEEPIIPTLPAFVFETELEFDEEYITTNISAESLKIYLAAKKLTDKTYEDVLLAIENNIREEVKKSEANSPRSFTVKAYNGLSLSADDNPADGSYIISPIKLYDNDDLYALFVTKYFENPGAKPKALVFNLSPGVDEEVYATRQAIEESDTHASFIVFPAGLEFNFFSEDVDFNIEMVALNPLLSHTREITDAVFPYYKGDDLPTEPALDGLLGNDSVRLYGVTKLSIAEFNRVEQEIHCYVPGEVSHIENIMAREYKEKAARNLTRTEITTEESQEREVENLNDTTSTDRHEMQSEISKVLQEDQSLQVGASVGVSGQAGPMTISVNGNTSYTTSSSETNSFNQSESYAQEVTERAMQRIVEKVSIKRTSRMLQEYEETNKHGFDNRLGDKHVTGIYRWVDKIFKNTLVNYGRRLMYDFVVPEPAKNFKLWMTKAPQQQTQAVVLEKPRHPSGPYGMNNPPDVQFWNYGRAASEYGADVEPPPAFHQTLGKSFAEIPASTGGKNEKKDVQVGAYAFDFEIPEGYYCNRVLFQFCHTEGGNYKDNNRAHVQVGTTQYYTEGNELQADLWTPVNISGKLPVSVNTYSSGSFALNVTAECHLTDWALQEWQNKAFIAIMEAYEEKLKAYKESVVASAVATPTAEQVDYSFNPIIGRAIEQRELKRICIEMMTRPFGINIGQDHYLSANSVGTFKVNQTAALEKYAEYVRFFEEAFDWEIMAYIFHPYYWGKEGDWNKLIKEKSSADYIFQAFLQSGMAKLTLPVKIGYEKAVLYFFDTGKVWMGHDFLLDSESDPYNTIDSLRIPEEGDEDYEPPATWFTRVPTSLTIIQSSSAPLDADGLPCYYCEDGTPVVDPPEEGEEDDDEPCECEGCNKIATGNNLLNADNATASNNGNSLVQSLVDILSGGSDIIDALKAALVQPSVCATITASLTTISGFITATVNDYNNDEVDCTLTLNKLNTYLVDLNLLLNQATASGCTTTPITAAITSLNTHIATIGAECNCISITAELADAVAEHTQIMLDYDNDVNDCDETVTLLNGVLTQVNTLLASGTINGCSLTAINAEITSLNNDIDDVQNTCDCADIAATLATYVASHAEAMTNYDNETKTCAETLTTLNQLLTDLNTLLAQAVDANCHATATINEITEVTDHITQVETECES